MIDHIFRFLKTRGFTPSQAKIRPIKGDGSKRDFWRIETPDPEVSFVAMSNPPTSAEAERENLAYAMIGNHLRRKGVPVPELYNADLGRGWFIMEDMGPTSLQEAACASESPLPIYERVLEELFRLQVDGSSNFDTAWCCQTERYDKHVMRRLESDYFTNAFLVGYLGMKRRRSLLEPAFRHLAEAASKAETGFLLHRDFQSRNIMIRNNAVGILDWQGARLGPIAYDFASLLIDPYTDLPPKLRTAIYDSYESILRRWDKRLIDPFRKTFPYLAIQRNLQILGAFAFLTKERGKTHFEAYIPMALLNLGRMMEGLNDRALSPLQEVVRDVEALVGPPSDTN